MKTKSINILNLCVPCHNYCRYCLLSWNGKCLGVDYDRSVRYARGFYEWLKRAHKEINFMYSFGYSMEHPQLLDAIKFMQETNSPGGEFLQFDGMKKRTKEELSVLLNDLKNAGIRLIDFTFYGTKEYHDKFAGRQGDFDLMMDSMDIALQIGLDVEVGIPVTKENLDQLEALVNLVSSRKIKVFLFTPHSGGRGISLVNSKITLDDFENLSANVKQYISRNNNKTPMEWLQNPPEEYENRTLTISLLPANIDKLENQSFEQTLKEVEKMDEEYYNVIPSFKTLLNEYADCMDERLYTKKDLYLLYRKRYIEEHNIDIYDVSDERFTGSLRY